MNLRARFRYALSALRGKSMLDLHPEILERTHIATVGADDILHAPSYSYLSGVRDHDQHVWVRKGVRIIADTLAALPVGILRDGKPVDKHPLIDLLTRVNGQMPPSGLWKWWATDMVLAGEAGWELVKGTDRNGAQGKDYTEIWPRQPHLLTIIPDKARRFYYEVAEYQLKLGRGDPIIFPPDEFLHFKFYNPLSPWRGLSWIGAARIGIQLDQYAQLWSQRFFQKGAKFDFVLVTPQGTTQTERDNLAKMFQEKYAGAEQQGVPPVLEEGMTDIRITSSPPKDMEWVEMRSMSREEIGGLLGVPDEIMGWGRDTYENFATAERVLYTLTIMPLAAHRDSSLTEFFRRYGKLADNESFYTDYSSVDALREGENEAWIREQGQLQLGVITVNEWRTQNGYKPFKTSDKARVPLLDTVGGIQGSIGILSAVALGQMDRESAVQLFVLFFGLEQSEAEALVGETQSTLSIGAPIHKAPAFGSPEHKALWESKDALLDDERRAMMRLLDTEIGKQQKAVIAAVQGGRSFSANGHTKQSAADVFDSEEEAAAFEEAFDSVVTSALRTAGATALEDLGLGIAFDLDRPEVRRQLERILGQFATKVNDTTYNELVSLFQQAESEGLSTPEIIESLDTYFDGRRSPASLERIARTTMNSAQNAGDREAWEQSGVVSEREWLSALDERTRPTHEAAHGQRAGLDEPFNVGGAKLQYPGDPQGPAEEIINCRCTTVPVVREEADMKPSEIKLLAETFAVSLREQMEGAQPTRLQVDMSPLLAQAIADGVAMALHAQPAPEITVTVEQPDITITPELRMPAIAKKIVRDEQGRIQGTLEVPVKELTG